MPMLRPHPGDKASLAIPEPEATPRGNIRGDTEEGGTPLVTARNFPKGSP